MEFSEGTGISRRRFLARYGALTAATGGLTSASAVAQSSTGADWPVYRGDVANTGTGSSITPTTSIQERWQFSVRGESFSAATVVDGTAYVGSSGNFVYAVDAATGERHWRFQTGNSVRSAPAVDDGTVYVGSTDANVYALSTEDGSERWSAQVGLPVVASPTPVGDTVYVGGQNGRVYALDVTTGEEQWVFTTHEPIHGSLAVVDGIVYGVNESGLVFALDAKDGRRYWKTQVKGGVRSPPVVADGTLYITSVNDRVTALSTRFGKQQWSTTVPIRAPATLAVTDSVLAIPGAYGTLYILDPNTGTERYQFNAGDRCYSPIVADGVLCVAIIDGVRAIDPATSAQHWSHTLGSAAHPALSVSNGVVYAAGEDGTLYAIVGDETPAPETDSAGAATRTPTKTPIETATRTQTATATRTPTETTTPASSRSGSGSTGTETPTPTPPVTTVTDTTTPAVGAEPSQPSAIGGNQMLVAGIGGAVVGSVLLAGYLSRRDHSTSDTTDVATEPYNGIDSDDGRTDIDTENVTADADPDELVEKATRALEEGQRAKEEGDHGRAATHLEDAVEMFDQALSTVDDDRVADIRDELEAAKAALLGVDSARQTLDEVQELLGSAEVDMENAIVAFVNDQRTVARVRFRQARDRYERVIDRLEDEGIDRLGLSVEISTDESLQEIDTFDKIPGIDADTVDTLREAGYDSPTDLRELSIEELATVADVRDKMAARLKVASWHTPSNQRRFESVDDVAARLESATLGYRSC